MSHLELRNVSKTVIHKVNRAKLRTQVLSDIDLKVERGELVTVMGPSGSGKTTLLRLINRLSEIDSGVILLDGKDTRDYNPMELRRRIGMIFQVPVVFKGSVRDNLAFGVSLWGNEVDAEALAASTGVPLKLLDADAEQLSVGEKQRVCIARALANRPEVLLLDEPTSALDVKMVQKVEDLLLDLSRNSSLTMLWVTHDREQAERVGGRKLTLRDGRLEEGLG